MSNIGRVINSFHCNGFFGRVANLERSVIVGEGADWVVVRDTNGVVWFADFQVIEKGRPVRLFGKQELIDQWVKEE